jgi:hypothetical protein
VQQGLAQLGQLPFVTLRHRYKIFNKNVSFLDGSFALAPVVPPQARGTHFAAMLMATPRIPLAAYQPAPQVDEEVVSNGWQGVDL